MPLTFSYGQSTNLLYAPTMDARAGQNSKTRDVDWPGTRDATGDVLGSINWEAGVGASPFIFPPPSPRIHRSQQTRSSLSSQHTIQLLVT